MKVILTGSTGNLGSELLLSLIRRGHNVITVVRNPEHHPNLEVLTLDLESSEELPFPLSTPADCVVHAAGVVHFKAAADRNTRMTRKALELAEQQHIPFYHISTAFIQNSEVQPSRNQYESDKAISERVVQASGVPWAIFRPSVLTGHSETGKIRSFSGYYLVIAAFIRALQYIPTITFPRLCGETNIIPIDWVANSIIDAIETKTLGTHYVTHPQPSSSDWLIRKSLQILGLDAKVQFLDCSLDEYAERSLSPSEQELLAFLHHFAPYWSGNQTFPETRLSTVQQLDEDYIQKILTYAKERNWQ